MEDSSAYGVRAEATVSKAIRSNGQSGRSLVVPEVDTVTATRALRI